LNLLCSIKKIIIKLKINRMLRSYLLVCILLMLPFHNYAIRAVQLPLQPVTIVGPDCELPAPENLKIDVSRHDIKAFWENIDGVKLYLVQIYALDKKGERRDTPDYEEITDNPSIGFQEIKSGMYEITVAGVCPDDPREVSLRGVSTGAPQTGTFVVHDDPYFAIRPAGNGRINLNYELPEDANVSLNLFDGMGNPLKNLKNNESTKAGQHQIEVNTEGVAKGLYFIQFRTGKHVSTQKFIQIND
jgi:hypothetical protein